MNAGPRRPGTSRVWITLGALVALIALATPATGLARVDDAAASDSQSTPVSVRPDAETPVTITVPTLTLNDASSSSVTATPTVVGVMGIASRGALVNHAAPQTTICASASSFQGIDVSYYQGSINWTQVAQSGRSFAYTRAADGSTFIDPMFQSNYVGIKAAGMKAGAYLFFRPGQDPTTQANTLVQALKEAHFASGDLAPVLDVEVADGQSSATIVANLQTAVSVVQRSLGVTPAIYTASYFWDSSVGSVGFGASPLWTASWGVSCPGIPGGWGSWEIWQYNDNSTVPGISGPVDGDQSNGPKLPVFNPQNLTPIPTASPTAVPTAKPSATPTASSTAITTASPIASQTAMPTASPTTTCPTAVPTAKTTESPEETCTPMPVRALIPYFFNPGP